MESLKFDLMDDRRWSAPFESESFLLKNIAESTEIDPFASAKLEVPKCIAF